MLLKIKKFVVVTFVLSLFVINISAQTTNKGDGTQRLNNNNKVLLVSDFDVSKLKLLIEIVEKENLSQYTDESSKTLKNCLKRAKAIVANPQTQSSIDQAEADLSIAFKYAEKSHIKRLQTLVSKVANLINTINTYKLDIVSAKSLNALNGELIGARVFLQEQPFNEQGALKVFNSFTKAVNNLQYLKDEYKNINDFNFELIDLISEVEKLNSYDYVRADFKRLNDAKNLANMSLNFSKDNDDTITKHQLFIAKHAIIKTRANLEKLDGSKLKLEVLIEEVENIDLKLYKTEGQKELLTSLKTAQQLLETDEKDSDAEIDVSDKELDELYKEALLDLSLQKENLQLIATEIKPDIDQDVDLDTPADSGNNQQVSDNDRWSLNAEMYLIIAIVTGSLIMIAIISYMRYKNKVNEEND